MGRFLGWYYNALRERNGDNEPARIVIGKDTRRSSYMFEYSLVAGLTASGADAYLLHVTTTPSVAYIARVDDFDCGIMISASHNPYYDNGIKLIDCYGEKMPEETLLLVEDYIDGKLHVFDKDWPELPFAHVHNGSLFERMFSSQIFKNPGCRGCKDHFAEQAEISFCDFWNAEERKTESEGNSCVIIRSARADEYFNKMQKLGFIEVVRDLDEKEVADTQMHALKAKKGKLHSSIRYHVFTKAIDYVFAHNLYERLGIREYNYFCKFYRKLCEKQKL